MKKKLLFSIFFFIGYIFSYAQCTDNNCVYRGALAGFIYEVLYDQDAPNNYQPMASYPTAYIDNTGSDDLDKKISLISYLDYGDGVRVLEHLDSSGYLLTSGIVSRGEALVALMEAWNIPPDFIGTVSYNDVDSTHEYYGYINEAEDLGLLNVFSESNFYSDFGITTDELIALTESIQNTSYHPVSTSILQNQNNYFVPHLYISENIGMFKGLEQGVFSHYAKNSFVIPDIQMSLNFSHFYSTSMVELPESFFLNQPLGRGWSHNYNIFAQRRFAFLNGSNIGTSFFDITWADGTIHIYNGDDNEWVTEGVYNEVSQYSDNGNHYLEVTTKDHTQYLFQNLNDNQENYYLVEIIDKNGNKITIDYEDAELKPWLRRIEKVISPSGKELVFDYFGNSDRLRQIIDPIEREINFTYSNGRLRDFTDAKGNETEYSYVTNNTNNNFERFLLKEIELPRNNKIEATYDSDKDSYLSSYKVNDNDPVNYNIQVDYDSSMPITVSMDIPMPDGGSDEHTAEYNSLGLLETFQSGTDDMVISYPSPSSSNPFLPTQVSNHNIDIAYLYDSRGNVEKIDYESGERIYEFDWNSENELEWSEDPRDNRTYYDYDSNHNLIKITDPLTNDINIEYYSNGNLEKITNQEGIAIDFTYHPDGPLQSFTAPENINGSFLYDGVNRLLSKTVNGLTSSYAYDDNDNIQSFTNSGQHTTVFSYDTNDNVATITNANNVLTTFTYNTKDQLESETFDSLQTEYSYNDDDTLDEVEKPSGQTIEMDYTSDGQYDGSGTVIDLQYDSNERVIRIETDDIEYQFQYDQLNQIDLVEVTGETRDVGYLYDSAGNTTRIYYPNVGTNAYVRYIYDDKNRLERLRAINFNNLPNIDIAEYTYLNDDRISQIEYGNGFITTYSYDDAGRPTGIKHEINGEVYYDEVRTLNNRGNVLDLKVGYRSEDVQVYEPNQDTQNFEYNTNNHITTSGFEVDDDGNTTASPIGEFIYDIDDQPRQRIANGVTSQYEYDAFGNRTKRTESNSIDKEYLWDILGKNIIQEYNVGSGDDPRSYAYGLGLEARIFNGIVTYYHGDLRGNVVLITDADGSRIRDYQYDPFGKPDGVNPAANPDNNEFTFLGKHGIIEDDRDAGLYYIRARYYDATIGRFITEDPLQSENLFVYGDNNPLSKIDYTGKTPFHVAMGIGFLLVEMGVIDAGFALYVNTSNQFTQLEKDTATAGAIVAFTTPGALYGPVATGGVRAVNSTRNIGRGFTSFSAFKATMGAAGQGRHWHHIVEQHAENIAKFGEEAIHNTENLVNIPGGFSGSLHSKVTGHYNSYWPGTKILVRDIVKAWSYQKQYDYGIKKLIEFGWKP